MARRYERSFWFLVAMPLVPSSFLLVVVWPGATNVGFLFLVAMPLVLSSFLLLVVWPGATSSDALCS